MNLVENSSNDLINYIELLVKETGNAFENISYPSLSHYQELNQESIGNLNQTNPYSIMQSFFKGSIPIYQPIEMQVIDNDHLSSNESHYAALANIQYTDPFYFNLSRNKKSQDLVNPYELLNKDLENDIFIQLYFLSLSLVVIYIIYKFMLKS